MGWENEMTREEKIEFLSRYKEIDYEINRLCEELSVWRARVTKITPTYSSQPKGGQQEDQLQSAIEKIMELEEQINAEIDSLQKARTDIIKAVRTVNDKSLQKLLVLRYLSQGKNYSWEDIAIDLNYTYRHVTRIHKFALDKLFLNKDLP